MHEQALALLKQMLVELNNRMKGQEVIVFFLRKSRHYKGSCKGRNHRICCGGPYEGQIPDMASVTG